MTGQGDSASTPALRQEAAAWVARLQRPDGEQHRPALERWLAADPAHLAAYNRVAGRFTDAKILRQSARWGQPVEGRSAIVCPRRRIAATVAALGALSLIGLAVWLPRWSGPADRPPALAGRGTLIRLASSPGEIRTIILADRSRITLDTRTVLIADFSAQTRSLRLVRGRARFEVAHESRPFIVHAGGGQVLARGTVFDVELGRGGVVKVALVEGRVDVTHASAPNVPRRPVDHLVAGQQIAIGTAHDAAPPMPLAARDLAWPEGIADVDNVALGDLLARANRYAARPLVVTDAGLAATRLSGRFRIAEPRRLADNVADLLDLEIRETPDTIQLIPRK